MTRFLVASSIAASFVGSLCMGACTSAPVDEDQVYTGVIPATTAELTRAGDSSFSDPCKAEDLNAVSFTTNPSDAQVRERFPEQCRDLSGLQMQVELLKIRKHSFYPNTSCSLASQEVDSSWVVADIGDTTLNDLELTLNYSACGGQRYEYRQDWTYSLARYVPIADRRDTVIKPPFVHALQVTEVLGVISEQGELIVEFQPAGGNTWYETNAFYTWGQLVAVYVDTVSARSNPPTIPYPGESFRIKLRQTEE